jgi:hypothetical protein
MPLLPSATIPSATPMSRVSVGNVLFYPIDMGSDPSKTPDSISVNRPIIMFTCASRVTNGNAQYIGFPIPQGIEFSDGASYDDASLGYGGAAIASVASDLVSSASRVDKANALMGGGGIDQLKGQFGDVGLKSVGIAAAGSLDEGARSAVGIGMKMTMNKHIVTEFTGIGTRSFGFKFKLVGSSKKESEIIRNIGTAFRNGLYPEADVLALKYPPTWTIRFMMGNNDISYLPKIWECYLTSLNVSYNGSANLWHTDGAPIECDITVSFKETRALRHQDIRQLDTDAFINIPKESRDGYTLPQTEPLFANSGTTDLIRLKQSDQNTTNTK